MQLSLGNTLPTAKTLSSLKAWHSGVQAQQAWPQQSCGCRRSRKQCVVKAEGREDGVSAEVDFILPKVLQIVQIALLVL